MRRNTDLSRLWLVHSKDIGKVEYGRATVKDQCSDVPSDVASQLAR